MNFVGPTRKEALSFALDLESQEAEARAAVAILPPLKEKLRR